MKHQYANLEHKYNELYARAQQNDVVQRQIAAQLNGAGRQRPQALFAEGMNGDEDLGMDIVMQGEHYHIAQKALDSQVVKPAAKFFATGMNGDEDLGLDIIMKGQYYHIAQSDIKVKNEPASKFFAEGMNGDEDLGLDIIMKGEHYHIAQKDLDKSKVPVNMKFFATGMNGDEDLGLDIVMSGVHYHIVQKRSDILVPADGSTPPKNSFT